MILFPNAKINLGLNIIRKRADGYHDLETFFCPVNLCDALEVIPQQSPATASENVIFTSSGIHIDGNTSDNICVKAWQLLKNDFPELTPGADAFTQGDPNRRRPWRRVFRRCIHFTDY